MRMTFKNPNNGHCEEVDGAWFYTIIFGPFYLALKGCWNGVMISVVAGLLTFGVSWLVIWVWADDMIRYSYLQRGWIQIDEAEDRSNGQTVRLKKRSPGHEKRLAEAAKKMGM